MNRRELLLNLVILSAILYVAVAIIQQSSTVVEELEEEIEVVDEGPPARETDFNPELARGKYPRFGEVSMFQPLITPTPTPPPPTPTPTPTPDIKQALGGWALSSVSYGEALVEDRNQKNPEEQFFSMKPGQSRPVEVEKGVTKPATLKKLDENDENPSATFTLEGTSEEYTLKMFQ